MLLEFVPIRHCLRTYRALEIAGRISFFLSKIFLRFLGTFIFILVRRGVFVFENLFVFGPQMAEEGGLIGLFNIAGPGEITDWDKIS